MKRFALGVLLLLGIGLILGPALALEPYSEKQEQYYTVHEDGSANITFIKTFYSPAGLLNKTKESIINMSVENATKLLINQEEQALSRLGLKVENASMEIKGYNTTGPLVEIFHGVIPHFSKYYSYGNVWEISLDLLRVADLASIDVTKVNQTLKFDNYFTVQLPANVRITKLPQDYESESHGSYVKINVKRNGNTVYIHSELYFKKGITYEDLNKIYGSPRSFIIQYRGPKGVENYTSWVLDVNNNVSIGKNITVLNREERYIKPDSYISYLKLQLRYQGIKTAEQGLMQSYAKKLESRGVAVKDGNVTLLNVNGTGPLVVLYHLELTNYTKYNNGVYIYTYSPSLDLGNISFLNRLDASINQTTTTKITLPEGGKFTQVPANIAIEANGSKVMMKIEKKGDREIIIHSNVYLRYGMLRKDYVAMMARVPAEVKIGYTLPSGSKGGICGPAALVALVIVPLLLRRRK
ncbi:CGP-CTERM sorting domain-containing protein [Thermococcus sp.]|uniref:CGP-CTERM sorting domain-containing protein n=1 Tax=Thermococcus sp. TaxID=35749 RepID=UPI0025FF11BD|nr:CGP-CTERM sorting domain-containing protein [Thermococcus sp.]